VLAFSVVPPDTPPTAEGDFAQTPYAHLVVYALDRLLTGEFFLSDPDEVVHSVRFERGVPVKIRMGDSFARLGDLLVLEGLVTEEKVEGAVLTGGLLGDVLVLTGCVESAALDAVLEKQFRMRMSHLFALPADTTYQYFDRSETMKDWGGEAAAYDPLELLWQGIRAHGEDSAFFEATLDKLSGVSLKLHPRAPLSRFCLEDDAKLVAELIGLDPTPLCDLLDIDGVTPEIARKFVYMLAICRHLDLGRSALPVGVDQGSRSLAKVQLKSQLHRAGVALDAPGDGERSTRVSLRGKSALPRDEDADDAAISSRKPGAAGAPASDSAGSARASSPSDPPAVESEETDLDIDAIEAEEERLSLAAAAGVPDLGPEEAGSVATAKDRAKVEDQAPETPAEESSRRVVADAIRSLSPSAAKQLVREKIEEKDAAVAADVCEITMKKLSEGGQTDSDDFAEITALHAWARSLEAHPDLKSLTLELDELIRANDSLALPRFVRGQLRKRLGDEGGATSDYRRVLEIDPAHEDARKSLPPPAATATIKRGETGFLKRLFRR